MDLDPRHGLRRARARSGRDGDAGRIGDAPERNPAGRRMPAQTVTRF